MQAVILDLSILIRYPKLLAASSGEFKFFTTTEVLIKIGQTGANYNDINTNYNGLLDLINTAISQKILEIKSVSIQDKNFYNKHSTKSHRFNDTNKSIIILGSLLKQEYSKVYLATQDKILENNIEAFELEILSSKRIEEIIENRKIENNIVEEKASKYEKSNTNRLFAGIIIGSIATVFVFVVYFNFEQIVKSINVWGTIFLSILLGVGLFIFREKQRFSYGVFEFLSGIATIIFIFYPKFNFTNITYSFDFYAKLLGCLYIMVRGQDNIVKSISGKKAGFWLKEKTGIG